MWPNPHFLADVATFTEDILNEKLYFSCRVWLIFVTRNSQCRAVSREFFKFVMTIIVKKNTVYKNHYVQIWYLFRNGLKIMLRLIYPTYCFQMGCFKITNSYTRITGKSYWICFGFIILCQLSVIHYRT